MNEITEIDNPETLLRDISKRLDQQEKRIRDLFTEQDLYKKIKDFCVAKGFFIVAPNIMAIAENQIGVGLHTKITGLADCLGIKIKIYGGVEIACHIPPFGSEKYTNRALIIERSQHYVNQLKDILGNQRPISVQAASWTIGSRPLFHGCMLEQIQKEFGLLKTINTTEL